MKIYYTLCLLIAISISMKSNSQSLANTSWMVYDTTWTIFCHFNFDNDTLSASPNNITYSNVSIYNEAGSNFTINDLQAAGQCPIMDTGNYSFTIQGDTLHFILVNDPCAIRRLTVDTFHWIRVPTNLTNHSIDKENFIYPTPASDKLYIHLTQFAGNIPYIIFDHLGRIVSNGKFYNQNSEVNISGLVKGFYIITLDDKHKSKLKIIKE